MCGICGFCFPDNRPVDLDALVKMASALEHRGPDEEGYYAEAGIALGHRRLSIIDLDTGRQPIHNEDKSIYVVFNGEIYNFPELKEGLEERGHKFYTKTDTEVLVHLYEEMEERCLEQLNGMFAFAIWDSKKRKLFLARDRVGIKPLYYAFDGKNLFFASELKSLLKAPFVDRRLDLESLSLYLTYDFVPAPHSIFKGIQKLPPGHYLLYREGQLWKRAYWDLDFRDKGGDRITEEELCQQIWARFRGAVRMRLISDVPLGVLLSGGIDSTSVIAALREEGVSNIKTFSIGFEDPSFDESSFARRAAAFFETEHYEEILDPQKMLDILPTVASLLDEPMADASIVPTFLLSQFTRRSVKVALGGDGGDELFAGYPTYQAFRLAQIYAKVPSWLRNLVERWAMRLPVSFENMSLDFRLKKFIKGVPYPPIVRNYIWLGTFPPEERRRVLNAEVCAELDRWDDFSVLYEYLDGKIFDSLLGKLLFLDMKLYLQEGVLVKVDRASMANSLEVRVPFLDHNFVDFVTGIPEALKMKGLTTKYILKKTMKDRLPREIVFRKKKGFGIPVAKWINGELKDLFLDVFSEERIRKQGIFNPAAVRALLEEHLAKRVDNRKKLWNLFIFQLWWDNYGEKCAF
ncbi:MAG: asparagine synthase (glutamine-hydrolyzing) [Deltaproteobacteria bacterium]|nr:MAG: asparagine synthase (glutamine-hydrolyzing) [Deltaproteobacteria bacterium]